MIFTLMLAITLVAGMCFKAQLPQQSGQNPVLFFGPMVSAGAAFFAMLSSGNGFWASVICWAVAGGIGSFHTELQAFVLDFQRRNKPNL